MPRIVELKDQTPLLIRPEDTVNGVVAVCRCGLSGNWPYCDGTHKATKGEEPGKLYCYDRDLPQGTPRRREVGHGAWQELRASSQPSEPPPPSEAAQPAPRAEAPAPGGHGAGATPIRPPRPPPQHHDAPGHTPSERDSPTPVQPSAQDEPSQGV